MKKKVGMVLVVLGIVGFFAATQVKSLSRVHNERYSQTGTKTVSIPVESGSAYTFFFWGVDEETALQTWAGLDMKATVTDAGGATLFEEQVVASASEDTGGVRRAQNGFQYRHEAQASETLTVTIEAIEADYVDLEVFKDLPEWLNLAPGLSILLAIVGLVLFWKARGAV